VDGGRSTEAEIVIRSRHNSGDIAPDSECHVADGKILTGGYEVAVKLEVIVNPAVIGQKALCLSGGFEPLHLPFSSSCRLVRHFRPVVEVSALPMPHTWQEIALCSGITSQLVCHDHLRDARRCLQEAPEEALCRCCVATALHEDVENCPALVYCTPQIVQQSGLV
jgi:hypothetical protein